MTKPLIGVTANKIIENNTQIRTVVNDSYLKAVLLAGGIPVVIPSEISSKLSDELIDQLDGALFTGGVEDIDPTRYGAAMHPTISEIDPQRDEMEINLVIRMVAEKKPFLGICRGVEIINVALGGSLYTHIPEQHPGAIQHDFPYVLPLNRLEHTVQTEPASRLRQLLGDGEVGVNSFHHQGIRTVAPGLKATAFSSDGLVEGVELPGHPFALGVQWHPEELTDLEPMLSLFRALVQASSDI